MRRVVSKPAGTFMVKRGGSLNPKKHPNEEFDLFSIPSHDTGEPEICKGAEIGSSKKVVEPGDVLLSRIVPHIRRCWVVPDFRGRRQIASGEWIVFRSPDYDPNYIHHFLTSNVFHAQFMRTVSGVGGSLLRARPSEVAKIEIPLPPQIEQKRIATILDKTDALRRKRQQAIELADQFLRSVFLEMFGDPVSNPKGWPKVPFRSLVTEFRYGSSQKASNTRTHTALPILRIPNVSEGVIDLTDDIKFVELSANEVERIRLEKGDLLFVRTNGNPQYIGRCAVFDDEGDFLYASYLIRARLKEDVKLTPRFIQYCLSVPSYRSKIVKETRTTAGNFNINTRGLGALELIVPSDKKLREFEDIQARVKRLLMRLKTQSRDASQLFNSLSQSFFEPQEPNEKLV